MFRRRPTLDLRISCHRDLLALCVPFRRCPRTVVQRAERHPKQMRTGKLRRIKGAPRGLAWERPGERILFILTGVGVEFDPSDLFDNYGGLIFCASALATVPKRAVDPYPFSVLGWFGQLA